MKDFSRIVILILGMHRSGTSALSGVLNILGLDFGDKLMPPTKDNSKGYFENQNLYFINEKILKILGTTWDDIGEFPSDFLKNPELEQIRKELKEVIKKELADKKIFGIKDPRLCLLLPLYEEVLKDFGCEIKTITVWRNEVEIAESLQKRDSFDFEKSIKLCRKYWDILEKNISNKEKITVNFDELLNDPETIIFKIKKKIPEISGSYEDCKNKVIDFLEKDLKHYRVRTVDRLISLIEKNLEKEQKNIDLNSLVVEREKMIIEKEAALEEKDNVIARKNEEIIRQNEIISKKDKEIIVGEKMLARQKKESDNKDKIIFEKEKQIAEIKSGIVFRILEKWDLFLKRMFKKYPGFLAGYRGLILRLRGLFKR
ncbi:MAG TPA: hypothetical protein P5230_01795 [Candidatus Magasanikbacteria bacterium]|nr:hypothetical protein [Candidatus Magasanikbacteria bacterium]